MNISKQPLDGRRIVVTRARSQAESLSRELREAGATAIELPMIQFRGVTDPAQTESIVQRLNEFDWIVFTSSNAVRYFVEAMQDVDIPPGVRLACVGRQTAGKLARRYRQPEFVPTNSSGRLLAEQLPVESGQRILYPGPVDVASELLALLQSRGTEVERWPVYATVGTELPLSQLRVLESPIDAITFASPSAVDSYCRQVQDQIRLYPGCLIACIGPTTSQRARQLGLSVDVVPREYNISALVNALTQHFAIVGEKHG